MTSVVGFKTWYSMHGFVLGAILCQNSLFDSIISIVKFDRFFMLTTRGSKDKATKQFLFGFWNGKGKNPDWSPSIHASWMIHPKRTNNEIQRRKNNTQTHTTEPVEMVRQNQWGWRVILLCGTSPLMLQPHTKD